MKDLDDIGKICEQSCGLISGMMLAMLHEHSTAAGSTWTLSDPDTMEIVVTPQNAAAIYAVCKEIRSGYNINISKGEMKKIKAARQEAHRFLFAEANDPNTPMERKIELVKLTSKS